MSLPICRGRHTPDELNDGAGVGNVTSITDDRPAWSRRFCYDALDRLTKVGASDLDCATASPTFAYDARGNRTGHNGALYTYESGTERLSAAAGVTYGYDGGGNVHTATPASGPAQVFTSSRFNQVQSATVGTAVTTYGYDADQQRRWRLRADGVREYFVSGPGHVPLAEYRQGATGGLVWVRDYIYAGDRLIASVGLERTPLPAVTPWTDDPIMPGVTPIKAAHLTQLRPMCT
jgi:hypothetical protein